MNYHLPKLSFFTDPYCAGVSNKHCLLTFFIVFANRADSDEMPHFVAFHLDLHCLPNKQQSRQQQIPNFMTFFFFFFTKKQGEDNSDNIKPRYAAVLTGALED